MESGEASASTAEPCAHTAARRADAKIVGAEAFVITAGAGVCARIVAGAVFVCMTDREVFARIVGAEAFVSTTGRGACANCAGAVACVLMANTETHAEIAEAAAFVSMAG